MSTLNQMQVGGVVYDIEDSAAREEAIKLKDEINAYRTAVNLLDNSDFTNFIAQAGIGGNHGRQAYAGDRWMLVSGTVSKGSGGLVLNGTIRQKIPNAPGVATPAIGVISGTAEIGYDNGAVTITSDGGEIAWASLYEGSYTSDTIPPYVQKGYMAELLECQRYFFPLNKDGIGLGNINSSGTVFYAPIMLPVTMRTLPSVQTANNNYTLTNNGSQINVSAVLNPNSQTGNVVQIMLNVDGKGFNTSIVSKLWGGSGNTYVYLNADL